MCKKIVRKKNIHENFFQGPYIYDRANFGLFCLGTRKYQGYKEEILCGRYYKHHKLAYHDSFCLQGLLRVNAARCRHEPEVSIARRTLSSLSRPGVDPCLRSCSHSDRGSTPILHYLWCEGLGPPFLLSWCANRPRNQFATYLVEN